MRFNLSTILILLCYFAPLVVGIIANQADPNLSSGLGVAYLGFAGLALGVVATALAAMLSLRWAGAAPDYKLTAGAFVIALGLALLANQGTLSRVA